MKLFKRLLKELSVGDVFTGIFYMVFALLVGIVYATTGTEPLVAYGSVLTVVATAALVAAFFGLNAAIDDEPETDE